MAFFSLLGTVIFIFVWALAIGGFGEALRPLAAYLKKRRSPQEPVYLMPYYLGR